MEVMFLHVTGSFTFYGSYGFHVIGAHFGTRYDANMV